MNKDFTDHLRFIREHAASLLERAAFAERIFDKLDLSSASWLTLYGDGIHVTTNDRDDVAKILSIAPPGTFWCKAPELDSIRYEVTVDGVKITLNARDGALPPTCRIVERDVVLPACPERVVKQRVVECTTNASETTPAT